MKVLKTSQSWPQALQAMQAGKYANHGHWCANQPVGAPEFIGQTALGILSRPGHRDAFVVVTDTGIVIHEWRPSPEEFASMDWQIVEIEAKVLTGGLSLVSSV